MAIHKARKRAENESDRKVHHFQIIVIHLSFLYFRKENTVLY